MNKFREEEKKKIKKKEEKEKYKKKGDLIYVNVLLNVNARVLRFNAF